MAWNIANMPSVKAKKGGIRAIWTNKWRFLPTFFLVFFLTLAVLSWGGFIPQSYIEDASSESVDSSEVTQSTGSNNQTVSSDEVIADPVRLVIGKVGINAAIVNPTSRNVGDLDQALQSGVVRYPGTGRLGENSTMFLFGHSSFLPVVYNKAYQSLNYLYKLEKGDLINVESRRSVYLYRVVSVVKENAADAKVDLSRRDRHLVIATCDSFGKKSDRYIVDAEYVGSFAK